MCNLVLSNNTLKSIALYFFHFMVHYNQQNTSLSYSSKEGTIMRKAWLVTFIRLPLLLVTMALFSVILNISFPFAPDIAVLYFMIVNIISLFFMIHLLKAENRTIWDVIDYQKHRLGKDILWGILWIFVLFIPFAIAINGVAFLMYGTDYINQFQVIFAGDLATTPNLTPLWLRWFGAIIALFFPFLNAPIEEIMYRGYAQPKFTKGYGSALAGIIIPSIGFGLQHFMLAASWQGALVYIVAFFFWGLGSSLIFHIHQQLFPIIIAHFFVNFAFAAFPIVFLTLGM